MSKKVKHCAFNEAFYEAWASKQRERELHIRIKEMHTYMRDIELKEEEDLLHCDKAIKKREKELRVQEEQLGKHENKRVTSFHCT
jgi:uncharacterized protein YhaN